MSIRLVFALAADALIRDAERDKLSAFNVFEDMVTQGFPLLFPRASVVFVLTRDPQDPPTHDAVLHVKFDGTTAASIPNRIDFKGLNQTRAFFEIQGLVVPRPCRVSFELSRGGATLGSWSFKVDSQVAISQPPPAPISPQPSGPPAPIRRRPKKTR